MKRYCLSAADSMKHVPEHAERTAMRSGVGPMDFDIYYQVWPSRAAMLKSLEMQQRRAEHRTDWHDCMIRVRSLAARSGIAVVHK